MSQYAYCKRGGMTGIRVSDEELNTFSDDIGNKALDSVIPLPNLTTEQQKAMLSVCNNHNDSEYWERDNGKHGWCCSTCGTVTQWG
jgi:hypothetical protein